MADTILKLNADSGAQIRYTLDKSEPTQDSALYSSQVSVPEGAVLKAKSFKSGYLSSDTMVYRNDTPVINWQNIGTSTTSFSSVYIRGICYNPVDKKYRLLSDGISYKSSDLINWDSESNNFSSLNYNYKNPQVFYLKDRYFFIADNRGTTVRIYNSVDFNNWSYTDVSIPNSMDNGERYSQALIFKGSYILLYTEKNYGSGDGFLFVSSDGSNFSRITNTNSYFNNYLHNAFIHQNKLFVVSKEHIFVTNDLQTWEYQNYEDNIETAGNFSYTPNCSCATVMNNKFVFVAHGRDGNYCYKLIASDNYNASNGSTIFEFKGQSGESAAWGFDIPLEVFNGVLYFTDSTESPTQNVLIWSINGNQVTAVKDELGNRSLTEGRSVYNTDTYEYFYISSDNTVYKLQF